MLKSRFPAVVLLGLLAAAPALADDIRPEARALSGERTFANEKCVEKCDSESDECMLDAEGDAGKIQVCDDKYSECLQACKGG